MSAYVSMLRGINVGGQKQLRMETLRGIFEGLGFNHVRSYVQSGNIVFESQEQDAHALAKQVEAAIEESCGFKVPVFLRQSNDLERILENNPFIKDRNEDPTRLHVTFLYDFATDADWVKVIPPDGIIDEFSRAGKEIYLFCPNGYGKTKLSNSFFEKKLGVLTTTRNWNTVNALYKMVREE